MWLYLIAGFLLVVGVIGGLLSGGIFTIVVLPLGVIVLLAALAAGMWARGAGASAHGGKSRSSPAHCRTRIGPSRAQTESGSQPEKKPLVSSVSRTPA